MIVAVLLIVKVVMHVDAAHRRENIKMSRRTKLGTVVLGLCTGFIIGFTSVGSGTLLAVFLILLYPLTTDRIVGTDIFHAMILLVVTAVAQIGVGNVDLWMVASCSWAPSPACCIGSQLTVKAPDPRAAHLPGRRAVPQRPGDALQGVTPAPRAAPRGRLVPSSERRTTGGRPREDDRCSSS